MFSHMMVGSNDLEESKRFYDALFGAVGGPPGFKDDRGRLIYMHNDGLFMVTSPIDGEPATAANGGTIGFRMSGPEQADAWHKAGVENGGVSIEDPPGVREASFNATIRSRFVRSASEPPPSPRSASLQRGMLRSSPPKARLSLRLGKPAS